MSELVNGTRTAPVVVGNLDSKRDWGYAKDYVDGMWAIMQHTVPDDWVLATGSVHTVRDVIECVSNRINVPLTWKKDDTGLEYAEDASGKKWIVQSSEFMRPNDVTYLCGDSRKIRDVLGWNTSVTFEELITTMVDHDLKDTEKR
jgi:GDPmannose 4,6-dehydratase